MPITRAIGALIVSSVVLMQAGTAAANPIVDYAVIEVQNCGRFTIAPGGGEDLVDPEAGNAYRIDVWVYDHDGDPVTNLAASDLWLDDSRGDHLWLASCQPIWNQADSGTDAEGHSCFTGTIYGGLLGDASDGNDCDQTLLYFYALGILLNHEDPICIAADSPDLNGSLSVGLSDLVKFSADYNCAAQGEPCDPCHDYNEDDATSLADFTLFAGYYNASVCP